VHELVINDEGNASFWAVTDDTAQLQSSGLLQDVGS